MKFCSACRINLQAWLGVSLKGVFLILIRGYQQFAVGRVAGTCRFYPTCSHYAIEALERHRLRTALGLIFMRLLRCHPFGRWGFDPVPERRNAL